MENPRSGWQGLLWFFAAPREAPWSGRVVASRRFLAARDPRRDAETKTLQQPTGHWGPARLDTVIWSTCRPACARGRGRGTGPPLRARDASAAQGTEMAVHRTGGLDGIRAAPTQRAACLASTPRPRGVLRLLGYTYHATAAGCEPHRPEETGTGPKVNFPRLLPGPGRSHRPQPQAGAAGRRPDKQKDDQHDRVTELPRCRRPAGRPPSGKRPSHSPRVAPDEGCGRRAPLRCDSGLADGKKIIIISIFREK